MLVCLWLTPLALQAPIATRRGALAAATVAALSVAVPRAADAAEDAAVELVEQISVLSMQARALQLAVREDAPAGRGDYAPVRARVAHERQQLQRLAAAMSAAAPDLRLCAPGAADCDCAPDPGLVRAAARYAAAAEVRVGALDMVLVQPGAFEELREGSALYLGGAVERELEMLCELTDAFCDLASGRPPNPMAARVAPLRPALSPGVVVPRRMPLRVA